MKVEIKYVVDGKVEFTSQSPVMILFYDVCRMYGDRRPEDAIKAANLAHEMWLKDDNQTPIGHLADYVAENYEELEAMPSYSDMLIAFYEGGIQ